MRIDIQVDGRPVRAFLDTCSDITIVDSAFTQNALVRATRISARISSVKTASGEGIVIEGICSTDLTVGQRRYRTNILVTPDMEGLVLGADWLSRKGKSFGTLTTDE